MRIENELAVSRPGATPIPLRRLTWLAIAIGLDLWLLMVTLFLGFVTLEVAFETRFHIFLPALSAILGLPFILSALRSARLKAIEATFLLVTLGVPLLGGWVGYIAGNGIGWEWFDTALFTLPFSLAFTRHARDFSRWLERRTLVVGVYFACLVIAMFTFGVYPPGYEPVGGQDIRDGMHLYYPTFLWLAGLILVQRLLSKGSLAGLVSLVLVGAGVTLEGHTSMFFGLIIGGALLVLRRVPAIRYAISSRIGLGIVAAAVVVASVMVILSWQGQDDRLTSRQVINVNRVELLQENLAFGVGLYDSSSYLGNAFYYGARSRFDERVFTVDSGYLDLALRYGALGGFVCLAAWFYLASALWMRLEQDSRSALLLPALIGTLAATHTWSMFTYEHGLFLLAGAFALDVCSASRAATGGRISDVEIRSR